jgi:hypothetical protein
LEHIPQMGGKQPSQGGGSRRSRRRAHATETQRPAECKAQPVKRAKCCSGEASSRIAQASLRCETRRKCRKIHRQIYRQTPLTLTLLLELAVFCPQLAQPIEGRFDGLPSNAERSGKKLFSPLARHYWSVATTGVCQAQARQGHSP